MIHEPEEVNNTAWHELDNPWLYQEPAIQPAPVRIIPVTPELRARDAAELAQRQSKMTWRRPEPLPPRNYTFPAGRSDGKRPSTKTLAPAPASPPAVIRRCDCGRKLAKTNKLGLCVLCRWQKKCRAARLARRVKCANPNCKNLLRAKRTEGICGACNQKLNNPEVKRRWREKKKGRGVIA